MLVDHLLKTNNEYIYRKKLDKACFEHDMAYGDFYALDKRTASDKVLHDKAFNLAKNPKYDGYQRGLVWMVFKFFDKKSAGSGDATLVNKSAVKNENILNQ